MYPPRLHAPRPPHPPTASRAPFARAGIDRLLDLGLGISPVKDFTGDSLEVSSWLFWRGASDGRFPTAAMLFTPSGLTEEAAMQAEEQRAAFEAAAADLLRFSDLRFASVRSDTVLEDFELPRDRQSLVVYIDHDEGRGACKCGWPTSVGRGWGTSLSSD